MRILLASQSPRRKELLAGLGYIFQVVSVDVDEVFPQDMPVLEVPAYLSNLKAAAYPDLKSDEILITADTVVVCEGAILGKPSDQLEAVEMLLKLSDKGHTVVTAVTVKTAAWSQTFSDRAEVEFESITSEEAEFYVQNYRPLDKAGSYGVQEWLGMAKIRSIQGSFYTIMGLPTHLVYRTLSEVLPLKKNVNL